MERNAQTAGCDLCLAKRSTLSYMDVWDSEIQPSCVEAKVSILVCQECLRYAVYKTYSETLFG